MPEFLELGWQAAIAEARGVAGDGPTYVSFDIDSLDPAYAPGTGTPSHGGFLYYEVLEILQGLSARGRVVGIDLVEVAPDYADAHFNLAGALARAGRGDEAVAHWQRYLDLDAGSPWARIARAHLEVVDKTDGAE